MKFVKNAVIETQKWPGIILNAYGQILATMLSFQLPVSATV